MILKNVSQKTVITSDLKIAESLFDRALGLLKQDNPRSLLFRTRWGIHTFLLKDSIDVIVLDSKKCVVIQITVKPNRFFFWNPKFDTIIELPSGTIKRSKTKIGDKLVF